VRVITILLALYVPAVAWGDDLPTGKLSDDDVAVEYRDGTYFSSL